MPNYFRKQGGTHVWEERPGKAPRYISFKEAKEKDLWSKVKNVSANVYKQLFPNTTEAEEIKKEEIKKSAATNVFSKEYGRQGPAKKFELLEKKESKFKKKEPVKKVEKVSNTPTAEQKAKEDWNDPKYKGKKVSAVRRLAAEKLLAKGSKEKSEYAKTEILKDGSTIGYKADGNWEVIKQGNKYVRTTILKDGTVVGYKEDGKWDVIKEGTKKKESVDTGPKKIAAEKLQKKDQQVDKFKQVFSSVSNAIGKIGESFTEPFNLTIKLMKKLGADDKEAKDMAKATEQMLMFTPAVVILGSIKSIKAGAQLTSAAASAMRLSQVKGVIPFMESLTKMAAKSRNKDEFIKRILEMYKKLGANKYFGDLKNIDEIANMATDRLLNQINQNFQSAENFIHHVKNVIPDWKKFIK